MSNYGMPAHMQEIHADPDYGDSLLNQASTQETRGVDMGPGIVEAQGPTTHDYYGSSTHNFSALDDDRRSGFGHVT
jgi:hypothetical protein